VVVVRNIPPNVSMLLTVKTMLSVVSRISSQPKMYVIKCGTDIFENELDRIDDADHSIDYEIPNLSSERDDEMSMLPPPFR